jgi:DNA-binding HxlR family transcriptional regulator
MNNLIEELNKHFDSRVRLGIMATLVVNDWVDFNHLKSLLNLTDGNLASHLIALEKLEYITVRKEFVARKPRTSYQVTDLGRQAFTIHLNAVESLIKNISKPS